MAAQRSRGFQSHVHARGSARAVGALFLFDHRVNGHGPALCGAIGCGVVNGGGTLWGHAPPDMAQQDRSCSGEPNRAPIATGQSPHCRGLDRKSVVWGKSVAVGLDLGGVLVNKNKTDLTIV